MTFDLERIVALADAAIAEIDAAPEEDYGSGEAPASRSLRGRARSAALASTLSWAAAALGEAGDPRTARYVTATLGRTEGYDDRYPDERYSIVHAIRALVLRAGERALPEAEKLVHAKPAQVRIALAEALARLSHTSERACALLFTLHADPNDRVRAAARASLGGRAPPVWWGIFASDPLATLSPVDANRLRVPFERALEIAARDESDIRERKRAFRTALRALPNDLAIPIIERVVRRIGIFDEQLVASWVEHDGGRGLARLVCDGEPAGLTFWMDANVAVRKCRGETRLSLLEAVVALLPADGSPAKLVHAIELARTLVPPRFDLQPYLERAFGVPIEQIADASVGRSHGDSALLSFVLGAVADSETAGPLGDVLVDAHRRGFPGGWRPDAEMWRDLLARTDEPSVRRYADAILSEPSGKDAAFALLHVCRRRPRGARRTSVSRLLASALASPALRATVLAERELVEHAWPVLRRSLRAGDLSASDCAAVVRVVDDDDNRTLTDVDLRALLNVFEQSKGDAVATAQLLPALVERRRVEPAHPCVGAMMAAWRESGCAAPEVAVAIAVSMRRAETHIDAWVALAEQVAEQAADPSERVLVRGFLRRRSRQ